MAYTTGERAITGWVAGDAVNAQLGEHLKGGPRVAATDGGVAQETEVATGADDSSDDNGARAAARREYARRYWTDGRYDHNFRFDQPANRGDDR